MLPNVVVTRRASRAALFAARDVMCDRLDEPLTLPALAALTGLSQHAFLRRFARQFGCTPHAYLTHLRLERAKALLVEGHLPVTEVCAQVGFESLGSFSALFARRVGESPVRYRRSVRSLVQVPDQIFGARIPYCFRTLLTSRNFGEAHAPSR
jgi:transcriptional regulator GlxA family with amidase domain